LVCDDTEYADRGRPSEQGIISGRNNYPLELDTYVCQSRLSRLSSFSSLHIVYPPSHFVPQISSEHSGTTHRNAPFPFVNYIPPLIPSLILQYNLTKSPTAFSYASRRVDEPGGRERGSVACGGTWDFRKNMSEGANRRKARAENGSCERRGDFIRPLAWLSGENALFLCSSPPR
jgi:hypothetical protein